MDILFQDDHFVAVNKPAGLLVHRSAIDRYETQFALQQVRDRLGRHVYPVHRLDKPTCGALLFALSADAAARMTEQFAAGRVHKTYLAIVRGHTAQSGVVDYPLAEVSDPATDALGQGGKAAQPAVTAYRRLAAVELALPVGRYASARYSLLEVKPRTGRRHQIRRHLKHIFHPLVGDTTHGDGKHNRLFRKEFGWDRLGLAATRLEFEHPYGGGWVAIRAPLDGAWIALLARLGWLPALRVHEASVAPGCNR